MVQNSSYNNTNQGELLDMIDGAYENDEFDGGIDFWKILNTVRKWWWIIGIIIITAILAAMYWLSTVTPVYRASASLEIKQQSRNIVDVSDVESVIADREFVTTQVELLKSKKLAEDVVISLNLISDSDFFDQENPIIQNMSRERKTRQAIDTLGRRLQVSSIGGSRLIQISFEHTSPQVAALITNTLTDTFIANSLARKFNSTVFARDFLEDRLRTVKKSLEDAERNLVEYASINDIIIIDDNGSEGATGALDAKELVTLNSRLTLSTLDRVEAQTIFESAQKDQTIINETVDSSYIASLRSKRTDLHSEYLENLSIFKPGYPDMIELKSRIDLFDQEIANEQERSSTSRLQDIKRAFELAKAKEDDLISRVNKIKNSVVSVREKSIDYNILERQVEIERSQYDALLQRLKEVSVSDEVGSNLVEIVDRAKAPRFPFKPRRLQTLLLVFLGSSALAFGLVFSIDVIDDRVRSPDEIKLKLKQTLMGVIPLDLQEENILTNIINPQSGIAESYASLRTNIQFSGPDGGPRVIQITSTRSGEGKSVSSMGLSARFAGLDMRVLLIDADMRRPTFIPVQESMGLSGILTSRASFESQIQATQNIPNLDILTSGSLVPNPSEILSGLRFDELIDWARENYEYVIVDSPPVLGLADAPLIGAKVDATLLITESNKLRTPNVKASIARLKASKTKLLGVVLTKYTAPSRGYSDYYKYSYGGGSGSYGQIDEKPKNKVETKRKWKL